MVLAWVDLIRALIFIESTDERIQYFANNGHASTGVPGLAVLVLIVSSRWNPCFAFTCSSCPIVFCLAEQFIICDSILIWRMHVIWDRRKWLTALALVLLLAEAGESSSKKYGQRIRGEAFTYHDSYV